MTEPAARKKVPEEIIAHLRARILRGEFEAGERLPPERELALMLNTNRNTLREALRALEAQGLVRARQGDGVRVLDYRRTGEFGLLAPFFAEAEGAERVEMLADLLRIRRLVAQEAVGQAARRATSKEIARMEALLERALEALERTDLAALADAELGLYRAITEASHSLVGLWLFNSLDKVARSFLEVYPNLWVTPSCYREDWKAILDGISAGSHKEARKAVDHLLGETDGVIMGLAGLDESAG